MSDAKLGFAQISSVGTPSVKLSIVIPTYNRADQVRVAVSSALDFARSAGLSEAGWEVIIVDDGSTDGTAQRLAADFAGHLQRGSIRVVRLERNCGATAAKNAGARAAVGEWLLFLDSDDELIASSAANVVRALASAERASGFFFRCLGDDGRVLGEEAKYDRSLTLSSYVIGWRWGECLPVVRRSAMMQFPYDGDLRGFEGLAYMRQMKHKHEFILSTIRARRYHTTGADRLCAPANLRRHSCLAVVGCTRKLMIAIGAVGPLASARLAITIIVNVGRCLAWRVSSLLAA